MQHVDLINDISLLTSVPYKTLKNLCDKGNECICHGVLESIHDDAMDTVIDISVGQIIITVDNDAIYYRFKPSSKLEEMLRDTVVHKNDPLINDIEQSLVSRIMNTYKDLV